MNEQMEFNKLQEAAKKYKLTDLIGPIFKFLSFEERLNLVSNQQDKHSVALSYAIQYNKEAWTLPIYKDKEPNRVRMHFWKEDKSNLVSKYVCMRAYEYWELLFHAIQRGFPKSVKNIHERLKSKKDVPVSEFVTKIGKTMLVLIRKKRNEEAINYLKMGVNPNIIQGGISLLQEAVRSDNYDMAKYLLDNGAQPDLKAKCDYTPMDAAKHNKYEHMITLLNEYLKA